MEFWLLRPNLYKGSEKCKIRGNIVEKYRIYLFDFVQLNTMPSYFLVIKLVIFTDFSKLFLIT